MSEISPNHILRSTTVVAYKYHFQGCDYTPKFSVPPYCTPPWYEAKVVPYDSLLRESRGLGAEDTKENNGRTSVVSRTTL